MSHYGYVSEQLIGRDLVPPRRGPRRQDRRLRRREASSRTEAAHVVPLPEVTARRRRRVVALALVLGRR